MINFDGFIADKVYFIISYENDVRLVSHMSISKIYKKAEERKQNHIVGILFGSRSDDDKQNSFFIFFSFITFSVTIAYCI
jgi:hypothetical protein